MHYVQCKLEQAQGSNLERRLIVEALTQSDIRVLTPPDEQAYYHPGEHRLQVAHHLGNRGHPGALLHELLDLGEGFRHSLRVHLPPWRSGTAMLGFVAKL